MPQVRVKTALTSLSDEPTALPSFFHRDLAYLLALEVKDTGTLSQTWQARIERWKRLLCWWLLGDVEEQRLPILPPLLDHVPCDAKTKAPVIDAVTWLLRRGADGPPQPIGTLSPFVLVRPSPDYEDDARVWEETSAPWHDSRWPGILGDLLEVLARAREHVPSGSDAQAQLTRLAAIIALHFERGQRSIVEAPRKARTLMVRHPRSLEGFALSVNCAGGAQGLPLHPPPECAGCHEVLLPVEIELAAGRNDVPVVCPKCGASTSLRLSDWLMTWFAKPGNTCPTLGVWTERALYWAEQPGLPPAIPPTAILDGATVVFEYPRTIPRIAHRVAPADRRLTLRVSGATIEPLRFDTVAFTCPLWPGRERVGDGIMVTPLRAAYLDLLSAAPEWLEPTTPPLGAALKLSLKGMPAPIRFTPSRGFERMQDMGLLLWPDPRRTGQAWQWYRLATHPSLELDAPATDSLRSSLRHATAGLPDHMVVTANDRDVGCTTKLDRDRLAPLGRGTVEVELGIDFGTTNSLAYSACRAAGMMDERPFEPHRLRERVFFAVRPETDAAKDALLDQCFPRAAAGDLATVPSELCEHGLIPWAPVSCCGNERVRYMFKAEPQAGELRRLFLTELATHALIDFVSRLPTPPERLDLTAVFAHPLSLTAEQKRRFQETVKAVYGALVQLGPVSRGSEALLVDESTAGIVSVGQPHASDVLLAADLGGGTLDVSLGRGTREERDQIGSLDCGGNSYLWALSAGDESDLRHLQRMIRSSPDDARARLSKPEAGRLLERYTGHLLFYLETMVASYVLRRPTALADAPLEVKLYLLGNGWGFFRFLARAGDDPDHVWSEGIAGLIRRMEQDLTLLLGRELRIVWARGDRPPKHAVAHGALKMAQALGAAAGASPAMALPAGINIDVSTAAFHLDWQDLFGPVTERNAKLRDRVLDDTVAFDFDELSGRIAQARVLAQGAPVVREADGVVRQALLAAQNRCGGVTPTGYLRGPLQLLLEHWTRKLGG